ncbi:MAG: hypothetical protein R3B47_12420 [Bacteroidia bacterium]
MKQGFRWPGLIALLCCCTGIVCTTDFDVLAPEEDIWVVYGILDQRDSLQYIRVSKAFQAEGDALAYASQAQLTVPGLRLRLDGPDGSLFAKEVDTVLRDSGLFPRQQTLYCLETRGSFRLRPGALYHLHISSDSLPGFFLEAKTRIPAPPRILRPSAGIRNDTIACLTRWAIEDSLRIIFQSREPGAAPSGAFAYQYTAQLFYRENELKKKAVFGPGKPLLASRGCGSGSGNILCVDIPAGQILDVLGNFFPDNGSRYSYDGLEACAADESLLPSPMELNITSIDSMLGQYLLANDPRYTNFNTVRREFSNISGSEKALGVMGSAATATRVLTISACAERRLGLDGRRPDPDGC